MESVLSGRPRCS